MDGLLDYAIMEKLGRSLKTPNIHLSQPRSILEPFNRTFSTPKVSTTVNGPLSLRQQTMCSNWQEPEPMAGSEPQVFEARSCSRSIEDGPWDIRSNS